MNSQQSNRLNSLTNELEKIGVASAAVAETMQCFLAERADEDCPDWVESDFLIGGLIEANQLLGMRTTAIADEIRLVKSGGLHDSGK